MREKEARLERADRLVDALVERSDVYAAWLDDYTHGADSIQLGVEIEPGQNRPAMQSRIRSVVRRHEGHGVQLHWRRGMKHTCMVDFYFA